MDKYCLTVGKGDHVFQSNYFRYGESKEAVIAEWMLQHPDLKIIEICKIEQIMLDKEAHKHRTIGQMRAHHKARIAQMRNNATSLMEDEDAILTIEERLQLSRVACQLDRILALWTERSFEIMENKK